MSYILCSEFDNEIANKYAIHEKELRCALLKQNSMLLQHTTQSTPIIVYSCDIEEPYITLDIMRSTYQGTTLPSYACHAPFN